MLNQLGLTEVTLIHYDVRDTNARAKTALDRFQRGRVEKRNGKTYRYPGLVVEGARWVGQSVFLLEPDLASRLIAKLQELRVRYSTITMFME